MKLYVADYLGDTHHLGALEHGAYLLLLMSMWRAGGSLPLNDVNLSRLARCSEAEWKGIRETVLAYFVKGRGRISHKRLSEEMSKYDSVSGQRSKAGKEGQRQKANKIKPPASTFASDLESNCRHNQSQNQNHKDIASALEREDGQIDIPELERRLLEAADGVMDLTSPATHILGPILALIRPGVGPPADLAMDVLPTIKARAARMPKGRTRGWGYFVAAIIDARDARLLGAPAVTERPPHDLQSPDSPSAKRLAREDRHARAFAVSEQLIAQRAQGG
jgi:uncharacterized protein YdaU (DUF1376 family)